MGDAASVGIIGGCLAFLFGWAFLVRMVIRVSRPRMPRAPATPDLIDTPPAVVNLMAHGFVDAPEAAAATLLDLAARRYVTLEQPGTDMSETVVRVVTDDIAGLTDYERRVLDRVTPPPGVAPFTLADLARRQAEDGEEWHKRVVEQVRADAARRGLVEQKNTKTPPAMVMLFVGLMITVPMSCAFGSALLALIAPDRDDGHEIGLPIAIVGGLSLLGLVTAMVAIVGVIPDERYTPAGRAVARHWSGVARWLKGHEAFAQLPPAAVTVWGRHLAHGVALKVAPAAAAAIDLRSGQIDLVRSSYGQQPRLVRVHYRPRRWLPLAPPAVRVLFAVLGVSALLFVLWLTRGVWLPTPPVARYGTVAAAAALVLRAAYLILRTIGDALFPLTVTGTVLRTVAMGAGLYVVVDDGTSAELSAWFVRPGVAMVLRPGELVRIRVHRWSGTVATLIRGTSAASRPFSTVKTPRTASGTKSSIEWRKVARRVG
ncbi:MAG TPA: hypothetical protein VFO77_03865, partial [Actinoplanes sp.]|nr:hypothetical protein [Actinoplanes sp.]